MADAVVVSQSLGGICMWSHVLSPFVRSDLSLRVLAASAASVEIILLVRIYALYKQNKMGMPGLKRRRLI